MDIKVLKDGSLEIRIVQLRGTPLVVNIRKYSDLQIIKDKVNMAQHVQLELEADVLNKLGKKAA